MKERFCSVCDIRLTVENSSTSYFRKGGPCRLCHNKNAKEWRKKNHEKFLTASRKSHRKHKIIRTRQRSERRRAKIGFTPEEFERKLIDQCGKCAICNLPMTGRIGACADHDHKTQKARDLLCNRCNKFIGLAKDSVEILESAIQYLRRHNMESGMSLV